MDTLLAIHVVHTVLLTANHNTNSHCRNSLTNSLFVAVAWATTSLVSIRLAVYPTEKLLKDKDIGEEQDILGKLD